jgi:hypothetical protein
LVLLSVFNTFVFDYLARQRIGGTHLSNYILEQCPLLPPDRYTPGLLAYVVPRVLELTYTAWDLRAFANDIWHEAGLPGGQVAGDEGGQSSLQQAILRQWAANRDATQGGHAGVEPTAWAERVAANPFPHPPFKWDEARRAQLRADLNGLYGHLSGLTRDELAYILDTFPIVRRKDEARFGEYRTKRMVLEAYDRVGGKEGRTPR